MVLPCFRFKGNSTDIDDRVGLVVPYNRTFDIARCEGDFADRDCSISVETGDLTLGSVRLEDEGFYVCKKSFSDGISDSLYRLRQLNVNGQFSTTIESSSIVCIISSKLDTDNMFVFLVIRKRSRSRPGQGQIKVRSSVTCVIS